MVNYFVYATDDSGSTRGESYYNTKGSSTLKDFKEELKELQPDETSKVVYLQWSDKCVEANEAEVMRRYETQSGMGSDTLPGTVVDWLKKNLTSEDVIKLLYIITDGTISREAIRQYDEFVKIENVKFFALNVQPHMIDMSVAAMFIGNNRTYTVYRNDELLDVADLSKSFEYNKINIENFNETIHDLKSYIKLQFLTQKSNNRIALNEIEKLKQLRLRLLKELEEQTTYGVDEDLNVKNKKDFVEKFKRQSFYRNLFDNVHDSKLNVDSCINTLINYINNDKKSFAFDSLKFTQKFSTEIEDVDDAIFNVRYDNVEEIAFSDIITSNEIGVPVILLTHCDLFKSILFKDNNETACFSRFKRILDCPLFLIKQDNLKKSIEYYYNFEAFKLMNEHQIKTAPRTRQPFTGAIIPLEEFDDYNDYVIACTYFDGKTVPYNKGLFYYVLWKICDKLEFMDSTDVTEYFRRYVMRRIEKTKCCLGLSTISVEDPLIRVNLTTALWYCVELSSLIFKNDEQHFTKEKLRMYCTFANNMKEILGWFQYNDIDEKAIDFRAEIFQYITRLKRVSRATNRTQMILEEIFEKRDGFLISNIVNADNIYKLNYLKINHQKRVSDDEITKKVNLEDFIIIAYYVDDKHDANIPICDKTLRPYFVIKNKVSYYEQLTELAQEAVFDEATKTLIWEPISKIYWKKMLPLYKLYVNYVIEYNSYPTLEQYKTFILKRKCVNENRKIFVFPSTVLRSTENVYKKYTQFNYMDVNNFIKISRQSVNRHARIIMEDSALNKDEVEKFIKTSEQMFIQ